MANNVTLAGSGVVVTPAKFAPKYPDVFAPHASCNAAPGRRALSSPGRSNAWRSRQGGARLRLASDILLQRAGGVPGVGRGDAM